MEKMGSLKKLKHERGWKSWAEIKKAEKGKIGFKSRPADARDHALSISGHTSHAKRKRRTS
jgi:hypothetical protein